MRALGARFLGSSDSLVGLPPTSRCLEGLSEWLRLGRREYGFRASCNRENIKALLERESLMFEREDEDKAGEREFNFGQSLLEHI